MARNAVIVALAFFAAMAAGFVYETIERREDLKRLPRIGHAVDVGGRSMNIYCLGTGGPTVILSAGAPFSGYSWVTAQRKIAAFTQACWYDRAGFGWSDPGPDPRDSEASAKDLHVLLRNAGIAPPYILVGERFAALDMRVFAARYADVAGLVLVDQVPEDEVTNPKSRGALPQFLRYPQNLLAQGLNEVGLLRVLGLGTPRNQLSVRPDNFPAQEWATIIGLRNEPKTRTSLLQEKPAESIAEAHVASGVAYPTVIALHSEGGKMMLHFAPDAVAGAVRRLVLH